jgi:hypothetical protein
MAAQAAEARKTARPATPLAVPAIPTLGNGKPTSSGSFAPASPPTPGPEALASVLEPSAAVRVTRPPEKKAGRSFLVGAIIGIVLLGGAVAALMARKNASTQPSPPHASSVQP